MDTINPLSSIPPIGSATSQGRNRGSQGQQLPTSGQLLKALVVEAKGEGRFILDIGGNRLTASSTAPLAQGQALQLQVVKTEPQIELKIVNDTLSRFLGRSLTLLGKSIDLSSLFQVVRQLSPPPLNSLSPTSRNVLESFFTLQHNSIGDKDGGSILKRLIENLGLNLEHLLAKGDKNSAVHTLKAALLEMAHSFSTTESIAQSTSKILTTLELFQLAQLHAGTDTHVILPIPLPFVEQGYLLVEREEHDSESGDKDSSDSRFSLHLTMSELGNLRIDFLHNAEGVFIRFSADSQEKADFLATFSDDLKAAIRHTSLKSLAFSSGAPDPMSDLIRQLVPEGRSMLDTKV
ncbi:MAG: hypothetical protein VR65_28760 [Desulfobulbaceae bacterium BRH_c16a]|nr:MAG: hypothetical protein VR65_28760 [Desulfobulbaceae bacterium BRH_c16a]